MAGFVTLLHVVGWGVLVFAVAPHDYQLGSTGVLGVGVGLTAYMLGVRHAFDADHIASIDNTTRKLVGEGVPVGEAGGRAPQLRVLGVGRRVEVGQQHVGLRAGVGLVPERHDADTHA